MTGARGRHRVDLAALQAEALHHYAEGDRDAADRLCRRILALDPDRVETLHLAGTIAAETGRSAEAVELVGRAVAVNGENPELHYTLGRAFELEGQPAEALLHRGHGLRSEGRHAEAADCYWQALALAPELAAGYAGLGSVLLAENDAVGAVALFRRALALRPGYAGAEVGLGRALTATGLPGEAIEHYQRAFTLDPGDAGTACRLGDVYHRLGAPDEAIGWYDRALELRPTLPEAHDGMGRVLADRGRVGAAAGHFRQVLDSQPDRVEGHLALGACLRDQGLAAAAAASFRRALELRPGAPAAWSRLLEALQRDDTAGASGRAAEARRFGEVLTAQAEAVGPAAAHRNQRDPERRLRIGYVSPDFRRCAVSGFLEPLLANHDRRQVETVCYAGVARPDVTTSRFKAMVDGWVDTVGLDDAGLAERIRADGIDILVDLAGHRPGNRLPVFARRPAPVQVSWPADADTTGLPAIGWRLTDALVEPEGGADRLSAERLVRLPIGSRCWQPPVEEPGPGRTAPGGTGGAVTFGCFASLAGLSPGVVAAWAELLRRVPSARLRLGNRGLGDPLVAAATRTRFQDCGVAPDRLELSGPASDPAAGRTRLSRVDVVLDPFPCSAPAALCEALWRGVPVVTLAGDHPAGRIGAGLLVRVGLEALVAEDRSRYLDLAVSLATDRPAWDRQRHTLRSRLAASSVCDGPGFARAVEAAYRMLWRQWSGAGDKDGR